MKAFLVIVLGLVVSWHFSDFSSNSPWQSVVAPTGVLVFSAYFVRWILPKFGVQRGHKNKDTADAVFPHAGPNHDNDSDGWGGGGGDAGGD